MLLAMVQNTVFIFLLFLSPICTEDRRFPETFKFGVSTSSYQIEGAWNKDGKGVNIWDTFTHEHPERIADGRNGDIAADSYHKIQEDIELLKYLGVHFYRFSLSWSRILPTGFSNEINMKGINYYNNLIDQLLAHNITPMVTLFHWDLPQPLQDLGGWPNPLIADYFEDYAKVAFDYFGNRVQTWITFNEPKISCVYGYGGSIMAPGINLSGIGEYLCGHTILFAHARVYRMYHQNFGPKQGGEVGISLHTEWFEPSNITQINSADERLQFELGWFANPIFKKDYPYIMKTKIRSVSEKLGHSRSRLPEFSSQDITFIHGTYDFFSLNFYTASMAARSNDRQYTNPSSFVRDSGIITWKDPSWHNSTAPKLKVVPWALRKILVWIKKNYGNQKIFITENGFADDGRLDDHERIIFYQQYLTSLHDAIFKDEVQVEAFTAWSLMDNFEWFAGYKQRYGLFSVDFKDPSRRRKPKLSAQFYRDLIETHVLRDNYEYLEASGHLQIHYSHYIMFYCVVSSIARYLA